LGVEEEEEEEERIVREEKAVSVISKGFRCDNSSSVSSIDSRFKFEEG